jgi:hypothetical protein
MMIIFGVVLIIGAVGGSVRATLPVWPTLAVHKKITTALDLFVGLMGCYIVASQLFFQEFDKAYSIADLMLTCGGIIVTIMYVGFFIQQKKIPRKYVLQILNSITFTLGFASIVFVLFIGAISQSDNAFLQTFVLAYPIILIALFVYTIRYKTLNTAITGAVLACLPIAAFSLLAFVF